MATILVVDDEASVRFALGEVLEGHDLREAIDAEQALARCDEVDLVITDLAMPGRDGLELLAELRRRDPGRPVIMLTAHGDERTAVRALKAGAYDYLVKPFDLDEVLAAVARALETRQLRRRVEVADAERRLGVPLVGDSPAFRRVVGDALRVAPRDVTVVVRGETGTGKELIASLIHAHGPRGEGPLVRFNCAALPPELAEAELFGHARGAFTGADRARSGYFGAAHGGTIVLDEIGELPLEVQPKLLRALQGGEVQGVGVAPRRVDVRVVACTHRDLRADVAAGRFREDLYYRLAVVELEVPPLRARRDDIPLLAESIRRRHAVRLGLDDVPFEAPLLDRFAAEPWPGNVRELENTVVRLLALSERGEVGLADWDRRREHEALGNATLAARMGAFERRILQRTLEETTGNRSEAARRLGVTRTTLLDKLKRHGLR